MLILTQRLPPDPTHTISLTLALTAEERTRSRHHQFQTHEGQRVTLQLPRGTVLQDGDLLRDEGEKHWVRIVAKPEPVLTLRAADGLTLLRMAYHLGNRHVPLEITPHYLRLGADPVLQQMLERGGVTLTPEIAPFHPELGAYHHS